MTQSIRKTHLSSSLLHSTSRSVSALSCSTNASMRFSIGTISLCALPMRMKMSGEHLRRLAANRRVKIENLASLPRACQRSLAQKGSAAYSRNISLRTSQIPTSPSGTVETRLSEILCRSASVLPMSSVLRLNRSKNIRASMASLSASKKCAGR